MLGVLQEKASGFICRLLGYEDWGVGRSWLQDAFILITFLCGMVGQIIKDIEPGSPAEAAGLKNNDLVVAVNGESVEALDHDGVVEMIRNGGDQTTLLVLDKEADRIYSLVSSSSKAYIHALHIFMHYGRSPLRPSSFGLVTLFFTKKGVVIIKAKLWLKSAVMRAC